MIDRNDEIIRLEFEVRGNDFTHAGEASSTVKSILRQLGINSNDIRRTAIAMYEAEMNMVIHANGGYAKVEITPEFIKTIFEDKGPGIEDINLAMQEGYSTASDKIRELGFGAGMGLPNMKRNSDEFDIKSEVGKGTTVTIVVYFKG